jgi:hypothetical protein
VALLVDDPGNDEIFDGLLLVATNLEESDFTNHDTKENPVGAARCVPRSAPIINGTIVPFLKLMVFLFPRLR